MKPTPGVASPRLSPLTDHVRRMLPCQPIHFPKTFQHVIRSKCRK